MKKTDRRAFLQLLVGSVAVATIPIPQFLLPKPVEAGSGIFTIPTGVKTLEISMEGGGGSGGGSTLTQEMIEEAAMRAAADHGRPDFIMMSKRNYKKLGKMFGYKIIYRGDDIVHLKL